MILRCYLIEEGKSASKGDNRGRTPLDFATDFKRTAVIAYLESKGRTMNEGVVDDEIRVEAM